MAIDRHPQRDRTPVTARRHRVHRYAGEAHEVLDDIVLRRVQARLDNEEVRLSRTNLVD